MYKSYPADRINKQVICRFYLVTRTNIFYLLVGWLVGLFVFNDTSILAGPSVWGRHCGCEKTMQCDKND